MAGLELLYKHVLRSISCPQDAVICFVHWEFVKSGYKCLGTGDEPQKGEKKSEMLPDGWNACKELYTLRYKSNNNQSTLLLKAITMDSILIFNLMELSTEKVTDMIVNVSDYVDEANLQTFESVFINLEDLTAKLRSSLLPAMEGHCNKREKGASASESTSAYNLLTARVPSTTHPPNQLDPFAAGGADLDPFGGRPGGMIVDPLHSGFPRSGFDPSSGIPGDLPPGAVPPGARFDPFGPIRRHTPGPDPDHLPPPGHDDYRFM